MGIDQTLINVLVTKSIADHHQPRVVAVQVKFELLISPMQDRMLGNGSCLDVIVMGRAGGRARVRRRENPKVFTCRPGAERARR